MKVLVISIEYVPPLFSGNGTYSRVIVESLKFENHDTLVVSGVSANDLEDNIPGVIQVPLPVWNRHDWCCSYKQLAQGALEHLDVIRAFQPEVILAIDWTSVPTVNGIHAALGHPPVIWYPFRPRTVNIEHDILAKAILHLEADENVPKDSPEDGLDGLSEELQCYMLFEYQACKIASKIVTLSTVDAHALSPLIEIACDSVQIEIADDTTTLDLANVIVVNPPIRTEIVHFVQSQSDQQSVSPLDCLSTSEQRFNEMPQRIFFTCCVRLAAEKNLHHYVETCLALKELFNERNIIPFLCGIVVDQEYATKWIDTLTAAIPSSIVIPRFLNTKELCQVFQRTLVNYHPAAYEPYGLTILEASANGAPSIVVSSEIGALDLLQQTGVFRCDPCDTDKVSLFLQNEEMMANMANEGRDIVLQHSTHWLGRTMTRVFKIENEMN